ncbi:hypothetical protein [Aestuariivivens sp. NBU2969]|uniref:hypothetical protein n=1 Tax=Aestuariivivens sp. NBU2969 TaxID=2873267 RepID=UPI001CBEFB43|nr:hypothetical protein [Aestuariivivens sp. NBU2969]
MKQFGLTFILMCFTLSLAAQIDTEKKLKIVGTEESKTDSSETVTLSPSKSIINPSNALNIPKTAPLLDFPEKEFSMFPQEEFGNPGELYQKRISNNIADLKLSKEEIERRNGSTTDQYFGDFKSDAEFVNVVYRDHGYTDGDIIQVLVNDDIVHARVYLTGGFKGFKLNLLKGFNKIDFLALNQGESGPNTAEFKVIDDKGIVVSHNQWNLATGVKATVIVVKE